MVAIRELECLINVQGFFVPNSEVLDSLTFFYTERNTAVFSTMNWKQNESNISCHCSDSCL